MRYVKSKFTVWEDCEYQTIVRDFRVSTRWYELYEDGRLFVRAGFPWDGATGAFDTDDILNASLVHDIICELVNEGLLPDWVQALGDEEFRRIAKKDSMPWAGQMWTYFVVRFYQINKRSGYRRPIYEVPS